MHHAFLVAFIFISLSQTAWSLDKGECKELQEIAEDHLAIQESCISKEIECGDPTDPQSKIAKYYQSGSYYNNSLLNFCNMNEKVRGRRECPALLERSKNIYEYINGCKNGFHKCGDTGNPSSGISHAMRMGTYVNSAIMVFCKESIDQTPKTEEFSAYKLSPREIDRAIRNKITFTRATGKEDVQQTFGSTSIDLEQKHRLRVDWYNQFENLTITGYVIEVRTKDGRRLRYSQPEASVIRPLSRFVHVYTEMPKLSSPILKVVIASIEVTKE